MGQAGERRRLAAGAAAALLVAATLAAAFTLVFGSGSADAKPEFLAAWGTRYPGAAGSRIATCLLCHRLEQEGEETEYRMNPYGRAAGEACRSAVRRNPGLPTRT